MDDLIIIENKIYEIRGQKVMLDFDLAEMYEVETKYLKQMVRRNAERFPEDFMFQLSNEEVNCLISSLRLQIATSNKGGTRYSPFAFTEHVTSDRDSYEKQFDELFSAFAKLSAAIQVKSTPMGRIEIKGFRKENDNK